MYKGVIIKQSLKNPSILDGFEVLDIDPARNQGDWDIFTVRLDRAGLESVKENLVDNYYAHFAGGNSGIVVFKDRIFEMNRADRQTWIAAIDYGREIGIPDEQLDFEFDSLL